MADWTTSGSRRQRVLRSDGRSDTRDQPRLFALRIRGLCPVPLNSSIVESAVSVRFDNATHDIYGQLVSYCAQSGCPAHVGRYRGPVDENEWSPRTRAVAAGRPGGPGG